MLFVLKLTFSCGILSCPSSKPRNTSIGLMESSERGKMCNLATSKREGNLSYTCTSKRNLKKAKFIAWVVKNLGKYFFKLLVYKLGFFQFKTSLLIVKNSSNKCTDIRFYLASHTHPNPATNFQSCYTD